MPAFLKDDFLLFDPAWFKKCNVKQFVFSKNINQMFQRPAGILNVDAKALYWTTAIFNKPGKVIENVNPIVNRARIDRAIIKRSNSYSFCNGMKFYKGL